MNHYNLNLKNTSKEIFSGHIRLGGSDPSGKRISFTNYYMEINGSPYFVICGEFHFSRYDYNFWEDELIKMKMCGVNTIATYVFWIHHEEEEGIFEWEGNKNLRRFVELCAKQGLYVILRIGPFCHGEMRNGGLPDWLYGRPFDIRSNDEGYLFYVNRLYGEIGRQVSGLMFKDGGTVIGVQLENEFMSAAAPWETTPPQVHEWTAATGGKEHMRILKDMAVKAGLDVPVYTCTGWGGSPILEDEILPLYGDYAFWPWIFYGDAKEHPATNAYLFRNYHDDDIEYPGFSPSYKRNRYPYACCEMGGGMQVWYNYRFTVPPISVEAMTLMKVAGGCNFIGYYMFHGGSNPVGKHSYMNERSCPKISYDFQAPLGEYGQVRESYRRLKLLHYFFVDFRESLCRMKTVLPENAKKLKPQDTETLRFAARVKGQSGFLFLNNYQDHLEMKDQENFTIDLEFDGENVKIPENGGLILKKDVCCILPFNFDMDGVCLKYSTTQLITCTEYGGEKYYFFFVPEGMNGEYCFDTQGICDIRADGCRVEKNDGKILLTVGEGDNLVRLTADTGKKVNILTLTREQSLNLWKVELWGRERLILTDAVVLASKEDLKLECIEKEEIHLALFPNIDGPVSLTGAKLKGKTQKGIFTDYCMLLPHKAVVPEIKRVGSAKAVIKLNAEAFSGVKEVMLQVDYTGDVGYAYIDGKLINDNFCNGTTWEIGLKRFEDELLKKDLYLYISPIKKGSYVKTDSAMAARLEVAEKEIAEIHSIRVVPVLEVSMGYNARPF